MMRAVCILSFILALSTPSAFADSEQCAKLDVPKHVISDHGGRWIELAPAQWQFLRGVYAANPGTPATLPVGDRAVLAQIGGSEFGLVFFVDGDRACTPILVSREVVEMLRDVGTGEVKHAGAGL